MQREETYTQRTLTVCAQNVCVHYAFQKQQTKFILFHVFCFAHSKQLAAFFPTDLFFHLAYEKKTNNMLDLCTFQPFICKTKHYRWVFCRFSLHAPESSFCQVREWAKTNARQHESVVSFLLHALHNSLLLLLLSSVYFPFICAYAALDQIKYTTQRMQMHLKSIEKKLLHSHIHANIRLVQTQKINTR